MSRKDTACQMVRKGLLLISYDKSKFVVCWGAFINICTHSFSLRWEGSAEISVNIIYKMGWIKYFSHLTSRLPFDGLSSTWGWPTRGYAASLWCLLARRLYFVWNIEGSFILKVTNIERSYWRSVLLEGDTLNILLAWKIYREEVN
jgi:hypothetical protein